jgi:thiol-disulfide isomerase/thioredoxin
MALPRGLVVLSAAAALGLLGSACGGDAPGGEASAAAEVPEAGTGSAAASVDDLASLPDLEMTEVATGRSTTLAAELASDGRPVVAWFWAPNCPTCRSEAPELDAFVEEHGSEVKLVGIGTRDDPELAGEFLEVTGVERFPLLWEPTGEAWSTFGVTAQPYSVLYDAEGAELQRWPGGATGEEILEELDRSA